MRSWEEAKKTELLRGDKLLSFKGNYKSLSSIGLGITMAATTVALIVQNNNLQKQVENENSYNFPADQNIYQKDVDQINKNTKQNTAIGVSSVLMLGLGFYFAL